MWISNLNQHRPSLHPALYAAFEKLDKGEAEGVDYKALEGLRMPDGSVFRMSESFRSFQDQADILAKNDGSTYAKPGESFHQWGLAGDLIVRRAGYGKAEWLGKLWSFSDPETWLRMGIPQYFENAGFEWGGRWTRPVDVVHFQHRVRHPSEERWSGLPWWETDEWRFRQEGGGEEWKLKLLVLLGFTLFVKALGSRLVQRVKGWVS